MTKAKITQKTKINFTLKYMQKPLVLSLAFFILITPLTVLARTFDPHDILTDEELFSENKLTTAAIQKFLENKNSVLSRYSQIIEGKAMKASEMIWKVGNRWNINPEFILATLEKEQGLIRSSQATEKALDWATGYSCYGGTCKEKYRGFYNQIDATAETQQIYRDRASRFGFRVGVETKSFDDYRVTPQNQATANLYIYTPYVGYSPELGVTAPYGGNRLFWRIWQKYFTAKVFVDGQVVQNSGNYYLIENNKKRKFASTEVFSADYKTSDAILVSNQQISAYKDGPTIEFANNTLVKASGSGQIFLLSDGQKRPIVDNSALAMLSDVRLATTVEEIPTVTDSKIAAYQVGPIIDGRAVYPQGKLFKDLSGNIWLVKDGLKRPVDNAVWQTNFNSETPETISSAEINSFITGKPIKLKDGTFVKSGNDHYIISSGTRMKITDVSVFDRIFGSSKKASAINVSTTLLELHDAGENIEYIDDTIQDTTGSTGSVTTPTPAVTTRVGKFDSIVPEALIMVNGQSQQISVKFKNTGSITWQKEDVWLEVVNQDGSTSSFGVTEKINFTESSVAKNQIASFNTTLVAPANKSGLLNQKFSLKYNKNGAPTEITSIGKFIIVKAGIAAQIVEHNLPIAVRNVWQPIQITMKIQNTSADTTWLSRKTALEIYNADGTPSYFYDKNDWIRKAVAAVPINKSTIAPGEVGEFRFTLDPRNILRGEKTLKFKLKLLDKEKEVYLNGGLEWDRQIRVD